MSRRLATTVPVTFLILIFATAVTRAASNTQPFSSSPLPTPTLIYSPLPTPDVSLLTPTVLLPPTPTPSAESQIALNYIGEKYGIPVAQLIIVNEHRREYAELGRSFRAFSLVDSKGEHFFELMVDLKDHSVVEDVAAIEQLEADAARRKYGKLEPVLYERLQAMQDSDVVSVTITVARPSGPGLPEFEQVAAATLVAKYPEARAAVERGTKPMDVEDPVVAQQIETERSHIMSTLIAQREAPLVEAARVLAETLNAQGIPVQANQGASVSGLLSKKDILLIEQRDDVGLIYLVQQERGIVSLAEGASASSAVEGTDTSALTGSLLLGIGILSMLIVFRMIRLVRRNRQARQG
ncbi:MAG TPA: hypothetical protein VIK33_13225 [Anaerolineae bacterium]